MVVLQVKNSQPVEYAKQNVARSAWEGLVSADFPNPLKLEYSSFSPSMTTDDR